jgi:hypothetical protein
MEEAIELKGKEAIARDHIPQKGGGGGGDVKVKPEMKMEMTRAGESCVGGDDVSSVVFASLVRCRSFDSLVRLMVMERILWIVS